jgi:multidrug efflux system membrane fusion protein
VVATAAPAPGVRYSATIEPFEQVTLAFKASGYVDQILRRNGSDGRSRLAQAGDRITNGTVLAHVVDTDYRERVNQGKAKLAEGEASLVKARLDLERARTLFASESLTKPELDAARANFDAAEARVTAARADIELAQSALRDCGLTSPSGGVILERRIDIGTLASAGTAAFVIGDVSSLKARFGIPDSLIQSVKLGDAIGVNVEAVAGATFGGRVTAIAPTADPQSRVFDVEVTIPNTDGQLRPGMIGTVAIGTRGENAAAVTNRPLAVPLSAVVRSEPGSGQFAVLVVEKQAGGDVARVRRVELGEVTGNTIAVTKGVNAGERVIVSGATLVVDGAPVRILPE